MRVGGQVLTRSLSHSLTLSLSHKHSLSHSLTHSLSHTHSTLLQVLTRANGLGLLVELKMGIFGITTNNIFRYRYNRPKRMNWHIVEVLPM